MGWRIIEINKNSYVKLFLNNLIIMGDNNISIPITDIDILLFTNNRTNVSINLLNSLADNNVCVFFCNEKYMPNCMLFPLFGNVRTYKIFEKQLSWEDEFKGLVWKKIVQLKCRNQINYLKHLNLLDEKSENELEQYFSEIEFYDKSNREGHIAKIYWHKLINMEFNRQNDDLQVNKLLNYGYTIINGMVARSIIKKGLDPRISLFHKCTFNTFALSSDLIEPFRNVVDILIVELSKRNLIGNGFEPLTIELKEICLDFIANFKVMINGLYQQLNNAIDEFVDDLVSQKILDTTIEYSYEIDDSTNDNYFIDEAQ